MYIPIKNEHNNLPHIFDNIGGYEYAMTNIGNDKFIMPIASSFNDFNILFIDRFKLS